MNENNTNQLFNEHHSINNFANNIANVNINNNNDSLILTPLEISDTVNSSLNSNMFNLMENQSNLNPIAQHFCPSKQFNNIHTMNNFPKNLNFVYGNTQGLLEGCHLDEFSNEISKTKNIHVCAISETWLRNRVNTNKSVEISGFKIYRSDRKFSERDRNKGGGVALYVKNNFGCRILMRSSDASDLNIIGAEFLLSEIISKHAKIFVAVVYRTVRCNPTNTTKLFNLIIEHASNYGDVLIFGDFNLNLFNGTQCLRGLNDFFSIVNHSCPTHFWPNSEPSLIDFVLTKNIDKINSFFHYNLIPATHHDLLFVSYKTKFINRGKPTKFSFRDYNKISHDSLISSLEQINWSELFNFFDINEKVNTFNSNYFGVFNEHVPITHVKLKTDSKPWFTLELNEMLSVRKNKYNFFKFCAINNDEEKNIRFQDYKKYCSMVKNHIKYLKRINFSNSFKKARTNKQKWNLLRTIGANGDKNILENTHTFDVNELNNFYASIHSSSFDAHSFNHSEGNLTSNSFNFRMINSLDVENAIRKISSNAIGFDGISIKFLKIILPYFIDAIVHIINYSLEKHIFPSEWNRAIIKPIGKVNEPKIVEETRPIVLNCVITKIISSIFNDQLKNYIENNNLLSEHQSGFRNKHSCTTALMRVSEDIRANIMNQKITIMVLLDIKSAYPSVSHDMLVKVLSVYGIDTDSLNWIKSFLINKVQIVELNGVKSEGINITCGLLQGDNLSQTFFSLVINGVVHEIKHCKVHLYADDLAIYLEIDISNFESAIDKINSDICRINDYINRHGMQLNPIKTKAMLIGNQKLLSKIENSKNISKVKVCDLNIEYSNRVKYLGFNFNNEFSADDHVNSIVKNVNFVLSKINHCRSSLNTDIKLKLLKGVIDPFFDYCAILYHGFNIYGTGINQNRLRVLYNSCIRFVCNLSGRDHVSEKYIELNILNDFNRRSFLICSIIHSFIHSGKPFYLTNIFEKYINNTRAGTDCITLKVKKVLNTKDELLLANCACRLWNSIPQVIRNINSKNLFAKSLKKYLFDLQLN